jgi:hypothetical protein
MLRSGKSVMAKRGKDLKHLIGASIVGTAHANSYKTKLAVRKVRTEFPELLQAATRIVDKDIWTQWTAMARTS